jgi:hypothetical protein
MDKLDKIIYYQLCDFLYHEYLIYKKNKKGKFNKTFYVLCSQLSNKFKNKVDFNSGETLILSRLTVRLCDFFHLNENECTDYLGVFLNNELWSYTYKSVENINTFFKKPQI